MKGEFKSKLDLKGRMNIPVKLREEFGNDFVISKTIGTECIKVYSGEGWKKLIEKIDSMPTVQTQDLRRFLVGSAYDITADKQGRISVPAPLREYAGLSEDVVVVGLENGAEIWDKAKWDEYNRQTNTMSLKELALSIGL